MSKTDSQAIRVAGISKTFKLPHEKNSSVKSAIVNFTRHKRGYEKQEVLKNISFTIDKGEFFGIVGRNGSGKSTLLKLLAGIYVPTKGSVTVNGTLTPFIELGVGFNHELTGRENVYLNGALLGFSRQEMDSMYGDIVEFAELEKFMDQKLKNYSSGMQVRLAFSIAIRVKSDILLIDEILAVGDAAFQQKCFEVFSDLRKRGITIVLVTHDMNSVLRFCDKAMLIHDGEIKVTGKPSRVAEEYLALNYEPKDKKEEQEVQETKIGVAHITKVMVKNAQGHKSNSFDPGEKCSVDIHYINPTDESIHFGLQIYGTEGGVYCFGTNTKITGHQNISRKEGVVTLDIDLAIVPGNYYFTVATLNDDATVLLSYISRAAEFRIKKGTQQEGVALLSHEWRGL